MNSSDNFFASWTTNESYKSMLRLMGSLSGLFSSSDIPFIQYRVTENLFCRCFDAVNLSRMDVAYDAKIGDMGIGIKTFQMPGAYSIEKVAEFNRIAASFKNLKGEELAHYIARVRNERMRLGDELCGVSKRIYHIVARKKNKLVVFNSPYRFINEDGITNVCQKDTSLSFYDGEEQYIFYPSKSVLQKRFEINLSDCMVLDVDILKDPYAVLMERIGTDILHPDLHVASSGGDLFSSASDVRESVVLPLYSLRAGGTVRYVPERSGLNQWNASGRMRDPNEVYIPIPKKIHKQYPSFFPERNECFVLHLPDGTDLSAKICQDGGKALMSNPNKSLGQWLLRKVLKLQEGELLTMDKLDMAGFDSVNVAKDGDHEYSLFVCTSENRPDDNAEASM